MFVSYSLCLTALLANWVSATSNQCPKQFHLINRPVYGNDGYVCASVTCSTKWGYYGEQPYHVPTQTTTKTRPAVVLTQRTTTTKTVQKTYTAPTSKKTSTAYRTTVTTATSVSLTSSTVTELATTTRTSTHLSTTTGTETDTSTETSSSTYLTTTTTTTTTANAGATQRKRLAKHAYPTLVQCYEVDQPYRTSIVISTSTKTLQTTTTPKKLITSTSTVLKTSTTLTTSTALSTASTTQTVETDVSSTITSSVTTVTTVTSTTLTSSTSTAIETVAPVALPFLTYQFDILVDLFDNVYYIVSGTLTVDPNTACGSAPSSYQIFDMTGVFTSNSGSAQIAFDASITAGGPDYCLVNEGLDTSGVVITVLAGEFANHLFRLAEDSIPGQGTILYDVSTSTTFGNGGLVLTLVT